MQRREKQKGGQLDNRDRRQRTTKPNVVGAREHALQRHTRCGGHEPNVTYYVCICGFFSFLRERISYFVFTQFEVRPHTSSS